MVGALKSGVKKEVTGFREGFVCVWSESQNFNVWLESKEALPP